MREFLYKTRDGMDLCAYAWEAEGPWADLCLIHGLGEHAGRYEEMAQTMNRAGICVYAYDQRGHGRSPGKRATARLEELSLDAKGFVERIHGQTGRPTLLFGHSMGGGIGLYTLLFHQPQVVGAIITSPWLRLRNPPPGALISLVGAMPWLFGGMNMKNGIDAALLSHDQAVVQGYPKDPLNHSMVGLSLAADMVRGGERSIANAGRLKVPLLLMHGEEDGICDVEGSRAFAKNAGPNCRLETYPGQFHELHNEPEVKQALFQREIDFVREAAGRAVRKDPERA